MTKETKKQLMIALDPGFDATKVTINDVIFKIPAAIADITDKNSLAFRSKHHMLTKAIANKVYLMGEEATAFQDDTKRYSYDYFATISSQAHSLTCIAYALVQYEKHCKEVKAETPFKTSEIKDWDILLGIALPHDVVAKYSNEQKKLLAGPQNVPFEEGTNDYQVQFNIPAESIVCASQAVVALMGILLDDDGILKKNMESKVTLLIDGGFNTMGIFKLSKANTVEVPESNQEYAMYNVYKEISKRCEKEYRRDLTKSEIDSIINEGKKTNVYSIVTVDEEGNTAKADLKGILDEVMEETIQAFMEYLNRKFNNLIDIERIVICGGTGKAYYDGIVKYIKEKKQHIDPVNDIILTDYEFKGQKISPEFGVSVGLRKYLELFSSTK